MRKKHIAILATMILSTSLVACRTSDPADNTDTNIKVATQSVTTLEEHQTEKPVMTEDTTAVESTTDESSTEVSEEILTDTEATDMSDNTNGIHIVTEPVANIEDNNYVESYEPSDEPAYAPADIPAEEPVDDTPAPAEPAVHEHNWTPVYCYIEWIASQTTIEDQYVPGGTVTITRFEQAGQLTDHYECDCGATKDGENKSDIAKILSTKNVPEGGILYYTSLREYEESLCKTLPSYSGYGQWHPSVGQW